MFHIRRGYFIGAARFSQKSNADAVGQGAEGGLAGAVGQAKRPSFFICSFHANLERSLSLPTAKKVLAISVLYWGDYTRVLCLGVGIQKQEKTQPAYPCENKHTGRNI